MKRLLFIMPLFFILLVCSGCDEAGTMMKPVVADDPADVAPTTTVGEVKQPEPEAAEATDPEPTTPEPTEPTTPNPEPTEEPVEEPEPEPIVTIESMIPADDGSVTISGTSTDLPAETTITVTLGDTITTTATTDSDGNWAITVSAAEIEPLSAGIVTVTASTADTSDSNSFFLIKPAPSEPTPPTTGGITLVEVGSEYTFTLEGQTYPGYNPSPEVQRILDTHPSAQLPNFEEAVKMTEVMDWVYRKVWEVYPDWETNPVSVDKRVAARDKVRRQFGLTQKIWHTLEGMYLDFLGYHPESRYWFFVECYRLLLTYPEQLRLAYPEIEYNELRHRFAESLEKGYIVGQTNPND